MMSRSKRKKSVKGASRSSEPKPIPYSIEWLRAAATRRTLRPWEAKRLKRAIAGRKASEDAAYQRRVKYAISRDKTPPPAKRATQRKIIAEEREAKAKRKRKTERKPRVKSRKLTSRAGKQDRSIVYDIQFDFDDGGWVFDSEQIREVFRIEKRRDRKGKPRVIRAFAHVTFKDSPNHPIWYVIKDGDRLARQGDAGADSLYAAILKNLNQYDIKRVLALELVGYN